MNRMNADCRLNAAVKLLLPAPKRKRNRHFPCHAGIFRRIIPSMSRVELNPSLKQAISTGTPVEVVDPTTNQLYYLISAEQFQKMAATISSSSAGDFNPREAYPLIDRVMAEDDAVDPLLDSYQ